MAVKLFVGSLPYTIDDEQLQQMCAAFGTVVSAKIILDRDTNQSKGFGFVEMETEEEAQAAIRGLDGKEEGGRRLAVSKAKPMVARDSRPPRY